ncbi:LamG-like jellyroll fold domain-containing protein [Paenibacillus sp. Soil766]|uniref:LamG-like jellyroll fold domain-containing protein n=1 Tax=Paenibacillus sp. Soil766 TaxID=1736404 RepID=UPI0009EBA2F6|nr:LamG-like jellyroll fold domain-containing protein [Paenibacillus sp. Soil766]
MMSIKRVCIFFIAFLMIAATVFPTMSFADGAYLMSYFRSGVNQTDVQPKLHYAVSRDGKYWFALNANNPVWTPVIGSGILRDPFLNKWPDGKWHLVFTTGCCGGAGIGHAESTNLISWGTGEKLHLMQNFSDVFNMWAPEWTYDSSTGNYRIYWSSTRNSSSANNNKHYSATTTDWNTFSNASLLFDPGYSAIDANIAAYGGNYNMFFKDESPIFDGDPNTNGARMRQASSTSLGGPYGNISGFITPMDTEAPTVFKLQGQNKWLMLYDYWSQGKFGIKESTNIANPGAWSAEFAAGSFRFPYQVRHASVSDVSESEYWNVVNEYSRVAYFKMDGTSGSTVTDSSGDNNHATLDGATWTTAGKINGALNFDGTNDYVLLADNSSNTGFMHNGFDVRSVSLWFKADNTNQSQVLYEQGGSAAGMALKIESGSLKFAVREGSLQQTVSTPYTDTTNWHHAVAVFNNGSLRLFLDGELKQFANAAFSSVSAHSDYASLGARRGQDAFGGSGNGAYFDGKLDEVRVFSVPFTIEDVLSIYNE